MDWGTVEWEQENHIGLGKEDEVEGRNIGRDSWSLRAFEGGYENLLQCKHSKIYKGYPNELSK